MSNDTESPQGQEKLEQIAASLERGENVVAVTVRDLLRWFGAERRGPQINQTIRYALSKNNLFTKPELNRQHLDGLLEFGKGLSPLGRLIDAKGPMKFRTGQPMSADQAGVANAMWQEALLDHLADWSDRHPSATQGEIEARIDELALFDLDVLFGDKTADIIPFPVVKQPPNQEHPSVVRDQPIRITDATFRIGRLPCANKPPTCVAPNSNIIEAITIMRHNDFSQLPVMVGERDVRGALSWRSIVERARNCPIAGEVRDFMDEFSDLRRVLSADATLLDAVNVIEKYEYVLVMDQKKKISGIVTLTDVSDIFRKLSTPFILLEEIERHIRGYIGLGEFSSNDLQLARDPRDDKRQVTQVTDLTFGDYVRLLQRTESWQRLNLPVDRGYFIGELDKIRSIRNEVMHFDPDGISDESLRQLEKFAKFLQGLRRKSMRQ